MFAGPKPSGIERCYAAADALGLVSDFETFGMVVLEAMAAGLPVIGSDRMGVPDLGRDGEHGFVVPVDATTSELGARIAATLDPAQGHRMGSAGRAVAERHTWQGVAEVVQRVHRRRLEAIPVPPRYPARMIVHRTPQGSRR